MKIVGFMLFLAASHYGALQVFRITSNHAYFWKGLAVLLPYAALVGALLFYFGLHKFFLWQVVLASVWLFFVLRRQGQTANAMLALAGNDADAVRAVAMSSANTSRYLTYSAVIYVVVFSITYLVLYNWR